MQQSDQCSYSSYTFHSSIQQMFRCAFPPLSETGRGFKTEQSRRGLTQMGWTQAESCSTPTRMGSEWVFSRMGTGKDWMSDPKPDTGVFCSLRKCASWPFLCFSFLTCKPGCEAHPAGRGCKVPCSESQKHLAGFYPPLQTREAIIPTGWESWRNQRGIWQQSPDPKGIQDKTKPSQALTLAELTAGLPWAMLIPVKLLRLVLNRDIECVTNVRIVQIAHW